MYKRHWYDVNISLHMRNQDKALTDLEQVSSLTLSNQGMGERIKLLGA